MFASLHTYEVGRLQFIILIRSAFSCDYSLLLQEFALLVLQYTPHFRHIMGVVGCNYLFICRIRLYVYYYYNYLVYYLCAIICSSYTYKVHTYVFICVSGRGVALSVYGRQPIVTFLFHFSQQQIYLFKLRYHCLCNI